MGRCLEPNKHCLSQCVFFLFYYQTSALRIWKCLCNALIFKKYVDISQFTTDGCLTNLYTDVSMIYASGDNILQVEEKLQQCVKKLSSWYKVNRLKINIDKTKVMLIGSKSQLKSLNVADFILSYDDKPLELVENAKYLGMFINCDISWDFHGCQSTYYHISLLRRLRRIFPMNLLLQVYTSYIQPRLDYGITLYGCSTQKNIDLVQTGWANALVSPSKMADVGTGE